MSATRPSPIASRLAGFAGRRVVVVGDLIADEYLYGKPARISREAPVLILRFRARAGAVHGASVEGARTSAESNAASCT